MHSPARSTSLVTAVLVAASLLAASCGDGDAAPDPSPASTTAAASTTTAAPTTTTTSVPTARLAGRVYLVDRDAPVDTTVDLVFGEEDEEAVDSTRTADDGSFSFEVAEPGRYRIRVEISGLLDECERLRTELTPGTEDSFILWLPVLTQVFDENGIVGQYLESLGREMDDSGGIPQWQEIQGTDLESGTEWTVDLMLGCD